MLVLLNSKRRRIELITKYDRKLQIFIESVRVVRRRVRCSNIVSDHFTNIKVRERDNGGSIFRKKLRFVLLFFIDN